MSDAVDLTDLCGACHNPSEGAMVCEDCETIVLQQIIAENDEARLARRRARSRMRWGRQKPHGTPPRWVR